MFDALTLLLVALAAFMVGVFAGFGVKSCLKDAELAMYRKIARRGREAEPQLLTLQNIDAGGLSLRVTGRYV